MHKHAHIVKILAGKTESLSNSAHWLEPQVTEVVVGIPNSSV